MNYTLSENIPKDVFGEIFSHLSFEDVLKSYAPNKQWVTYAKPIITKFIKDGALNEQNYSVYELGQLGITYPFISKSIILEINRRLNHNYLLEILDKFKDNKDIYSKFDKHNLSANPNIDIDIVNNMLNINWTYWILCSNPSIKLETIETWNHNLISFGWLSKNPNLTIDYVLKNIDKDWEYSWLSENPAFTINDIINNFSRIPWDISKLIENPNITIEHVKRYPDIFKNTISTENPNVLEFDAKKTNGITYVDITGRIINNVNQIKNIKFGDLYGKMAYADFPLKNFLSSQKVKDYHFRDLSLNPNLTVNDIILNPNKKWDFHRISENKFSKDPYYIHIASITISDILGDNKIPISINGKMNLVHKEDILGLIIGLDARGILEKNVITMYDIPLNVENAKIFFNLDPYNVGEALYLTYIKDKPYFFKSGYFISALTKSTYKMGEIYARYDNYEIIDQDIIFTAHKLK